MYGNTLKLGVRKSGKFGRKRLIVVVWQYMVSQGGKRGSIQEVSATHLSA